MPTCPHGHDSGDPEFCDVCGLAINAVAAPAKEAAAPSTPAKRCPACDTPLDGRFCEACGHDSLAAPPPRRETRPEPEPAEPAPQLPTWTASVTADRAYYNTVMAVG